MAYVQPQENLQAIWLDDGKTTAQLILTYRGREWHRHVALEDTVTVIEAAALLNVSRTAPYQWINQRRLPYRLSRSDGKPVKVFRLRDLRQFGLENGFL